jgi:hypothetical protein
MSGTIGITAQDIYTDTVTMANINVAGGGAGAGNITINSSTGTSYFYNGGGLGGSNGTISIGAVGSSSTILSGAGSSFNWKMSEEFVDVLPNFDRIQKMCEQYPGFKIAFEKFKTTYYLVKDDYDTPEDKRPKP